MIVVTGVGRSGTTFTSELLEGAFDVRMALEETDEHGEDPHLRRLLANAHSQGWPEDRIRHHLKTYLERRRVRGEPWGVKGPRLSDVLELALDAVPEAEVVWCHRPVDDVVASWVENFATDEERARARVEDRHRRLTEHLQGRLHVLVLDYARERGREEIVDRLADLRTVGGGGVGRAWEPASRTEPA